MTHGNPTEDRILRRRVACMSDTKSTRANMQDVTSESDGSTRFDGRAEFGIHSGSKRACAAERAPCPMFSDVADNLP